uniref:Uncharacterized protein n=1 Tax=Aegilops tauschii subsp. strangulata TaxID=200361 RepID=A0A452ZSB8_AEGTS
MNVYFNRISQKQLARLNLQSSCSCIEILRQCILQSSFCFFLDRKQTSDIRFCKFASSSAFMELLILCVLANFGRKVTINKMKKTHNFPF